MHIFVVLACVMFGKEAGLDPFGGIGMNSNEPGHDCIAKVNCAGSVPKANCMHSCVQDEHSQHSKESKDSHMSIESIVLHGRVAANEIGVVGTKFFALTSRVAVGETAKVDVRVGVSSDQVEEATA